MTERPKFVVDGMLGKLARWLRILGYDVKYYRSMDDDSLIEIAEKENRILLTRDNALHRKSIAKKVYSILLEEESRIKNLAKLSKALGIALEVDTAISRCPKCNSKIEPIAKNSIRGKVPEKTFRRFNEFWICPNCGQVYWRGSHWKNIYVTLNKVKKNVSQ
ncbi:Mut7-C RNAse domain-containing protein [Candidatus Bathyarchaeota archaeon]|nr:Mut7-C RNAse domain-containing protein [Candidatus Bathyarchaeota archaeon]